DDTVLGTNGQDVIAGQAGNDSVLAGGGNDMIFGGEGDDILTGGQGRDTIEGGAGDDFIFGALGADVATGGEGTDRFYASTQRGDQLRILDYNYDEGDFLVLDGDLVDRDSIELLYTTALTANGLETRDYNLGIRSENGFQSVFTFGNESEIDQILLRLPATEGGSVAPILFDLSDLV
ncbi:calcium-binding protein, partial [Sulfitobacter donghicola]